jgi:surface carbohydrate biosynthesis protein
VKKYKALCFVDDQQGRDVEMLLPLVYFAEKHLGCQVRFVFIWDIFEIYRAQPDIVILPNATGSRWLYEIAKYASEQNIPVFALISEGNYRLNGTFDFWGYNPDKKFYQESVCFWSERTRGYFAKMYPENASRMVVTGALGFDRYKIYEFPSKEEFLRRKGLTGFKKIIGYAGWSFGKLYTRTGREELKFFLKDKAGTWEEWTEMQRTAVEDILRQLIENNPDTLFILKKHPNETHPHIIEEYPNEMTGLKGYPNVLYIKAEENIHDLIAVSDLWVGFNTTTAIEAWLLGKKTILINPDPDFMRESSYKGSLVVKNYQEVQAYADEFFQTGEIIDFGSPDKVGSREKIIGESIGFADGLNHLRAAFYLKEVLARSPQNQHKPKFCLEYFIRSLEQHVGGWFYFRPLFLRLPKLKKTVCIFDRCKLKNIQVLKGRYYPYLDEFYRKNNLDDPEAQVQFWNRQTGKTAFQKD